MSNIPEELLRRWSGRDLPEQLPKIPTITLTDDMPEPPELDSLDDQVTSSFDEGADIPVSSQRSVPSISPMKLYGVQSVGLGSISIANYKPSKFK